ncbi:MAG: PilX N-terminal domain-containing pilus assembly protein [Thermodesulfobacteriota bacterium]
MRKKIIFLKDQSGGALVIALIMLIILTLIGLAATFTSTFEVMLSGNKRVAMDAFYSADSGIQVVVANKYYNENFKIEKYVDNKYNPFTDPNNTNPNPTNASVIITYFPNRSDCPRGSGESATGNFECFRYLIQSTGQDQLEQNSMKANCEIHEEVALLIPTSDLAGGD